MKRQLAAHGDYSSIAICQTNIPATYQSIFGIFHVTSTFLIISSTISCGTLVGKHRCRVFKRKADDVETVLGPSNKKCYLPTCIVLQK
jgi:hypothetical protein